MAETQLSDGFWVCSSRGSWLPGVYETRKACLMAYRADRAALWAAWDAKCGPDGPVPFCVALTEDDVRKAVAVTSRAQEGEA